MDLMGEWDFAGIEFKMGFERKSSMHIAQPLHTNDSSQPTNMHLGNWMEGLRSAGPCFNIREDVLLQDLAKSRSREIYI